MINIKKYDLGGFKIENLLGGADLTVVSLKKYELGECEPFFEGTPFADLHPYNEIYAQTYIEYSKISTIDKNFAVKDIVPLQEGALEICANYKDSIIYSERGEHDLYKCTASTNQYTAQRSNVMYLKYDDVFVIEEGDDDGISQKVTVFDTRLNPIKTEVIGYRDQNDYEKARMEEEEIKDKARNELNEVYPDYWIGHTEHTINALLEQRDFVTLCNDHKDSKDYLIKFANGKTEIWRKQVSENLLSDDILPYGENYYILYNTDKVGHKWRLEKISTEGETLDTYEFRGADAILTEHNGKPVIVYLDLAQFEPWQKKSVRERNGYWGPSALLVVEE